MQKVVMPVLVVINILVILSVVVGLTTKLVTFDWKALVTEKAVTIQNSNF